MERGITRLPSLVWSGTRADIREGQAGRHVCSQRARAGLQHGDHLPDGGGNRGRGGLLGGQQGPQEVSGRRRVEGKAWASPVQPFLPE